MAHILIVEDNEQLGSMLVDVIESWGYSTELVTDGRSCLAAIARQVPDILLLDVMLPGLNGYEICHQLKTNPLTSCLAIIMISALADVESRIHSYKIGADLFMVKPINYEELRAIIAKLLRTKEALSWYEEQKEVVSTLRFFLTCLGCEEEKVDADRARNYSQQVATLLGWSADKRHQAFTALSLRNLRKLSPVVFGSDKLVKLLGNLKMASFLLPIFAYLDCGTGQVPIELREELTQKDLMDIAELVALIDRLLIVDSKQNNIDLSLAVVRREYERAGRSTAIVHKLQQVIEDEKILQRL